MDPALLDILARAAPPADRAAGGWCRPTCDTTDPRVVRRARTWIRAATGTDLAFGAYTEARGLDPRTFLAGLCDVEVVDPSTLPAWATHFLALVGRLEHPRTPLSEEQWAAVGGPTPINLVLRPFLELALEDVGTITTGAGLAVTDNARLRIVGVAGVRLARTLIHVIDFEMQTAQSAAALFGGGRTAPLDGSAAAWRSRFDRYPVLAYLVSVVHLNWRAYVQELVDRLVADTPLLEARMFGGAALGALHDVEGDAGDLHDHGRAVALLTFASGRRLVYKPKDLRVSVGFIALIEHLNPSLPLPLHARTILARGPYTWEAWVQGAPCTSPAEVDAFYRRLGMTLRLLQLLGARDFWLDNLIAAGAHPVFIDLEMAVQQAPELPTEGVLPAERLAFSRIAETVVSMGVVAQMTPIGTGQRAEDLGALTPLRPFRTPFRSRYSPTMRDLITPGVAWNETITWTKDDYTPILDGVPAVPSDHFEAVIDGYRAMQGALLARREELMAPEGPIHALRASPARHIIRDTWSYIGIVGESVRTPLLVDGIARDTYFEGMMRPGFHGAAPDPLHLRKVAAELPAMREMDVSLFFSVPGEKGLYSSDGVAFPDYFEFPAIDLIAARVRGLATFPIEEEVAFLRSTFATGAHPRPPIPMRHGPRAPHPPGADGWLAQAVTLADGLLDSAIHAPDGGVAWIGMTYHPDVDMEAVDVLRSEILSGSCGLGIVLADIASATGETRFHTMAVRAMDSTVQAGGAARMQAKMVRTAANNPGTSIMCGAYYGFGAHLYALRRCAGTLSMPAFLDSAEAFLEHLPVDTFLQSSPADLACGLAGLALALAPLAPHTAQRLATRLVERTLAGLPPAPYPPEAPRLAGFPDAEGSILLALTRLSAAGTVARTDALAAALHRAQAGVRSRDTLQSALALALSGLPVDPRWLDRAPEGLSSAELLTTAELALAAGQPDTAGRCAAEMLDRKRVYGTFFPDDRASDRHRISALTGVGALIHLLTRLARPTVPSILAVA